MIVRNNCKAACSQQAISSMHAPLLLLLELWFVLASSSSRDAGVVDPAGFIDERAPITQVVRGEGCRESTTKCCITLYYLSSKTMHEDPPPDHRVSAKGASISGRNALHFQCCNFVRSSDPAIEHIYCSGPYEMHCPTGTNAALEDVSFEGSVIGLNGEKEDNNWIVGFCVEWKAMTKDIIQAGQARCLDVPLITEDTPIRRRYIYAWFTTTTSFGASIYVETDWADLKIKSTGEVMTRNKRHRELDWGPGNVGVEYEVCIKAIPYAYTILHIRLGGANEKH